MTEFERIDQNAVFFGNVPRGIRRGQFYEMYPLLGFSSEVNFAQAVIRSSAEERQSLLKRYYIGKHPYLENSPSFNKILDYKESHGTSDTSGTQNEKPQCCKFGRKRNLRTENQQNTKRTIKLKKRKPDFDKTVSKENIKGEKVDKKGNSKGQISVANAKQEAFTEEQGKTTLAQEKIAKAVDDREDTAGRSDFETEQCDASHLSPNRNSSILDDLVNFSCADIKCSDTEELGGGECQTVHRQSEDEMLRERVQRRLNITSILDDLI